MVIRVLILILAGLTLSSCGMLKRGTSPWEVRAKKEAESAMAVTRSPNTANLSGDDKKIAGALDVAYKDWKGVPYILGGTSYKGIDCSAFMQVVFEDYFELKLPRTTREQMKVGSSVRKNRIKTGDMVFFKTGRDTYHVGVMINNEQFLHASTSRGVTISALRSQYWENVYLTTRRIF